MSKLIIEISAIIYSLADLIGFLACTGIVYVFSRAYSRGSKHLIANILGFFILSLAFLLESTVFFLSTYSYLRGISPFLEPFASKYDFFWFVILVAYPLGYFMILLGYLSSYKRFFSMPIILTTLSQVISFPLAACIALIIALKANGKKPVMVSFLLLSSSHILYALYLVYLYESLLFILSLLRLLATSLLFWIIWRL